MQRFVIPWPVVLSALSRPARLVLDQLSDNPKSVSRIDLSTIDGIKPGVIAEIGSWIITNEPHDLLAIYCRALDKTTPEAREPAAYDGVVMRNACQMMAFCDYSYETLCKLGTIIRKKPVTRPRSRRFEERNNLIFEAYIKREPVEDIAKRFGVTFQNVYKILNEFGIRRRTINHGEIVCRFLAGETFSEIRSSMKLSTSTVRTALVGNGFRLGFESNRGSDADDAMECQAGLIISGAPAQSEPAMTIKDEVATDPWDRAKAERILTC